MGRFVYRPCSSVDNTRGETESGTGRSQNARGRRVGYEWLYVRVRSSFGLPDSLRRACIVASRGLARVSRLDCTRLARPPGQGQWQAKPKVLGKFVHY